jgi:hypothetical protein
VTQLPPRVRPFATALVFLVAVGAVLGVLPPAGAAVGSPTPSFGSTQGGTGVPGGPVTCSELVTGATLAGLVAQYYPNASLLPSESGAEQAVNTTWNSLCGSTPFQQAVSSAAGGWFAYISRMQDKNWTASGGLVGSLFVYFELTWNASCPSGGIGYPAGFECQYNDVWQSNLTDQAVTGPSATISSLRLVPCDTPAANDTAVGSVEGFFPDAGASPNESAAAQEVQTIWGEICTSASYYAVASPLDVPQALQFSTWRALPGTNTTLSTSGHLYFEWSLFTGDGPCPSENGSSSNTQTCSYSTGWTADLTLDTYTGPTVTGSPLLGGPRSLAPLAAGTNQSAPWVPAVVGFGAFGGVVVLAAVVGVSVLRRR